MVFAFLNRHLIRGRVDVLDFEVLQVTLVQQQCGTVCILLHFRLKGGGGIHMQKMVIPNNQTFPFQRSVAEGTRPKQTQQTCQQNQHHQDPSDVLHFPLCFTVSGVVVNVQIAMPFHFHFGHAGTSGV